MVPKTVQTHVPIEKSLVLVGNSDLTQKIDDDVEKQKEKLALGFSSDQAE